MPTIEMLPQAVIELQRELALYHPTLCRVLRLMDDEADRLGAIAVHCDMAVDGEFDKWQVADLCDKLLPKLRDKRETNGYVGNIIRLS